MPRVQFGSDAAAAASARAPRRAAPKTTRAEIETRSRRWSVGRLRGGAGVYGSNPPPRSQIVRVVPRVRVPDPARASRVSANGLPPAPALLTQQRWPNRSPTSAIGLRTSCAARRSAGTRKSARQRWAFESTGVARASASSYRIITPPSQPSRSRRGRRTNDDEPAQSEITRLSSNPPIKGGTRGPIREIARSCARRGRHVGSRGARRGSRRSRRSKPRRRGGCTPSGTTGHCRGYPGKLRTRYRIHPPTAEAFSKERADQW